jgi:hypothetical protein
MKIGVINCKVDENHDVHDYLNFLRFSAKELSCGLLVGPDYALANKFDMATPQQAQEILAQLKSLSTSYPHITFVPGTIPMQTSENQMALRAVVLSPNLDISFDKKTDCGEEALAKKHGLYYQRGNSQPNTFNVEDKKIWLHICGDRDRKPESRCDDSDIELILAHDRNAGFHIGISTPENSRYMVLSDSFGPRAEVIHYPEVSKFLKGKQAPYKSGKFMRIFEI